MRRHLLSVRLPRHTRSVQGYGCQRKGLGINSQRKSTHTREPHSVTLSNEGKSRCSIRGNHSRAQLHLRFAPVTTARRDRVKEHMSLRVVARERSRAGLLEALWREATNDEA